MRISYSALSTYKQCPQKYKFQEIDRLKAPKSKEALFGTAVHGALKYMFSREPVFPTIDEVISKFRGSLENSEHFPDAEKSRFMESGEAMLRNFFKKNPPWNFTVVDLESRFEAPVEDKTYGKKHLVVGIMDRVDKDPNGDGYEIIDYKTSRKIPPQDFVDNNLQLSVYQLGLLKRWPHIKPENIRLSLYFLKAGEKLSTVMAAESFARTEKSILETIRAIEKKLEENDFPPITSPLCSWCGYKNICPAWRHMYERETKPPLEKKEVEEMINRYASLKAEISERDAEIKKLASEINAYLSEYGLDRVFGDAAVIARKIQERLSFDTEKIRAELEAAGVWHDVLSPDQKKIKAIIPSLADEVQEKIKDALIIKKFTTLSISKRKGGE